MVRESQNLNQKIDLICCWNIISARPVKKNIPKIIQFLHTAFETGPQSENDAFIPWNNYETHRRKFLKSPGMYINN